jgi:hypothetical protein
MSVPRTSVLPDRSSSCNSCAKRPGQPGSVYCSDGGWNASLPAPSRTGHSAAVPAHPPIALVFSPLMLPPYAGYEPRQSLGIYCRTALNYAQEEYQAGHRAVPPLTISGTSGGGNSRSSDCRVTNPTAETDTLVSLSLRPNWELCRFQNRKLQSSGGALELLGATGPASPSPAQWQIGRQPGDRQADGQEPADALERQRGTHLLLQVFTRVLNADLADHFHQWYPGFTHTPKTTLDHQPLAA